MLRAALILLIAANGVVWAWGQGWWPGATPPDQAGREPARMGQQVRPEALQVLAPGPAAAALQRVRDPGLAAQGLRCLEAGPFAQGAVAAAEAALVSLGLTPADWVRVPAPGGDPSAGVRLRVAAADAALQARLTAMTDPALRAGFSLCENGQR